MVLEQVDLVDIKKASIRTGQQSRIKCFPPSRKRTLNIDGPTNAIFRGSQRKFHDRHRTLLRTELAILFTLITQASTVFWIAVIRTPLNDRNFRQQISERSHRGRLSGPAMPHDQDASDQRIDDIQQQGQLHLLLPDYCCERVIFAVVSIHRLHRLPDFIFCAICGFEIDC
jgi:hypothetical protein